MDIAHLRYEFKFGPTATYILLLVNIFVFILAILAQIFLGGASTETAVFFGGSYSGLVFFGEYWRLITAAFLHLEIWHLVLNMFALYSLGRFVENFYSDKKLFIIYILAGIFGNILGLFYFNSVSFGASGAIWGLIGVIFGNTIRRNRYSPGLPVDIKNLLPTMGVWFLGGYILGGSTLGHLGGLIAGVVLGLFFDTENDFDKNDDKITMWLYRGLIVLTVFSFIGMVGNWFI